MKQVFLWQLVKLVKSGFVEVPVDGISGLSTQRKTNLRKEDTLQRQTEDFNKEEFLLIILGSFWSQLL